MKKLSVTFSGVHDTTGYLFSFAKSLCAALQCSAYASYAEDIIAASGFAFRMWVDASSLCPSATSIWSFRQQKPWVENGGLTCAYVERLWGQNAQEDERRREALTLIRQSIDLGIAAVSWDISGCEWGLIIGYDDDTETLCTLKIDGRESSIPYGKLGKLDLPILSVLTITGVSERSDEEMLAETRKMAAAHLQGKEWCDNAKGLAAYEALLTFIEEKLTEETMWNLEYMLGTYAALKWYAWQYFEKHGERQLAELYKTIHEAWQNAFHHRGTSENMRNYMIESLRTACEAETKALVYLEE